MWEPGVTRTRFRRRLRRGRCRWPLARLVHVGDAIRGEWGGDGGTELSGTRPVVSSSTPAGESDCLQGALTRPPLRSAIARSLMPVATASRYGHFQAVRGAREAGVVCLR
jgi:hypothetical protein